MMNGMWSKSSKRYADRMERNVIILGLALGASLLSAFSSIKVPSAFPPSVSNLTSTQQKDTVKSSRRLCIVLLFLPPFYRFQVMSPLHTGGGGLSFLYLSSHHYRYCFLELPERKHLSLANLEQTFTNEYQFLLLLKRFYISFLICGPFLSGMMM